MKKSETFDVISQLHQWQQNTVLIASVKIFSVISKLHGFVEVQISPLLLKMMSLVTMCNTVHSFTLPMKLH